MNYSPSGATLPALLAAALLPVLTGVAAAASCEPDALTLDRGETRRVVICAEGLPEAYSLNAFAGVAVEYQQRLKHCGIGDKRPGVQLKLVATDDARGGTLNLTDLAGAPTSCGTIKVDVPERLRLPDATLVRRERNDDRRLELRVKAPRGIDLAPSCAAGPSFPATDGLTLAVESQRDKGRCSARALRRDVAALDARQLPAKIVLPAVKRADGSTVEAVTYAMPPAPRWLDAMDEDDARYVDVNGIRTRYFEKGGSKGRKEALVLVHGGQPSSMDGTAWDWQQNFDGLAERFHVYALDRLGQGYTANPANLDDYNDYYPRVVEHVRGFIRAMGLERVHLVGHSQGSWPVTRIALDEPGLVASLTLVDGTMVSPPHDAGSAIRFYLYLSQDLHPASGETLESVRRGMEFFSYTRNNLTEQRIARLLEMTKQDKYKPAVDWFAKSMMSPAHPKFRVLKKQIVSELEEGKLKVPVLVVWGRNDPEGSLDSGLALFRNVSTSSPYARLHVFGRSGHLSFIEHPEEFTRVLSAFALDEAPRFAP